MPISPEKEKIPVPEGIEERLESPEIPPHIEREGVVSTPAQVTTHVTDDKGQELIQSPKAQAVTIQIPASAKQLDDWSHGPSTNALTWFATFWLRLIKKALHFGWKIVKRGGQ